MKAERVFNFFGQLMAYLMIAGFLARLAHPPFAPLVNIGALILLIIMLGILGLQKLLERLNLIAKSSETSKTTITDFDPPATEPPAIIERGPAPNPQQERAPDQQRPPRPGRREVRSVPRIRPLAWRDEPSIVPDFALKGGVIPLKGHEGSAVVKWRVRKETKK
jgi:hypothetical protein